MAKEKVLVIEDRRENMVFLANQILRPSGYQVLTARDGEAGLNLALSESPDLIIMDFRMPKMTGIEVLRELSKAGKQIPVIITTFHGSEELAIEAFRLGARDYLIKPYEVEEMLAAIDSALSLHRRFRSEKGALQDDVDRTNVQLERRVKELNILSGIGKAVTSLRTVETILQRIVEAATYLTNAEEAFLMLVDEGSGELIMRAMQGMGRKYMQFRQKVDDSVAGQVVRTGRPVRISRASKGREVMSGHVARDLLNVPLKVRGKVIGVLGITTPTSKEGFSENDEYLLSALADYAAIAIDNARLYEAMEARTRRLTDRISLQAEAQSGGHESEAHKARLAEIAGQLGTLGDQLKEIGAQLTNES